MKGTLMQTSERPQREARTPATEAAFVLTMLQEKFSEMAATSPTWPNELDPNQEFLEIYRAIKRLRPLDADKERDEILCCFKRKAESGGLVDDGLLQIFYIPLGYCAQAQLAFEAGNDSLAWSLIADANYWRGVLAVNAGNQLCVQATLGGKARWRDAPKSKEKDFVFDCWKSWQDKPGQYKSQAAFARAMLEKCEHLESQKVIEDWCRAWKKGNGAG